MKPNLSSQHGQALILIALAAVGLFGIAALAIDGSAKFSDRRHAQNAADTAALAGALAMARAHPQWDLESLDRALENGYDDDHVSNEVEVYNPPTTGIYSNCSDVHFDCNDYVEVIITSHVETFFARVVGINETHNRVEAVASTLSAQNNFNFGGNAIVALSPEGCALKAAGNTSVTINGGGMYSNSDSGCAFHQQTCAGTLEIYNADGSQGSITMVGSDLTATEELTESLQNRNVPLVLYHAELRKDLPANFHRGLPIDADEKAPFSVDESDNPLGTQPFLLVVCTGRIVTRVLSTAGSTRVSSIWPDAFADIAGSVGSRSNLRTVIVHLVPMLP